MSSTYWKEWRGLFASLNVPSSEFSMKKLLVTGDHDLLEDTR
jgi:hypothetical protein